MDVERLKVIATYDSILDTDYSLLKTIVDKYNNEKYLNTQYLKKVSFDKLLEDLTNQEIRDPLKLAFKEGIDYKDIYDQLYENEAEYIAKYACPTNLLGLLRAYKRYDFTTTFIICDNIYQDEIVESYGFKPIHYEDNINIENFDCLYVKDCKDIINNFKDIKHKNIYISSCRYNYFKYGNDYVPIDEEIVYIGLQNQMNVYKLY